MLRPGRQAHIAEPGEQLADAALVQIDAEQLFDLLLQIDPSPAHHAVRLRIGSRFEEPGERLSLFGAQP